jgi:WXG100 family type VII secretion target
MPDAVAMTAETVEQAAIDTMNAKLEVDGNLQSLKGLCDNLAASWGGAGAAAFQEVMLVWDQEASDLLEALQNIADMLDASAAATVEQDLDSQNDFASFDAELS